MVLELGPGMGGKECKGGKMGTLVGRVGVLEGWVGMLDDKVGILDGKTGTMDGRTGMLVGRTGTLDGRMRILERAPGEIIGKTVGRTVGGIGGVGGVGGVGGTGGVQGNCLAMRSCALGPPARLSGPWVSQRYHITAEHEGTYQWQRRARWRRRKWQ